MSDFATDLHSRISLLDQAARLGYVSLNSLAKHTDGDSERELYEGWRDEIGEYYHAATGERLGEPHE